MGQALPGHYRFPRLRHYSSIELFAGGGGMSLGLAKCGVGHHALLEWDKNACSTLRENLKLFSGKEIKPIVIQGDAREFSYDDYAGGVDIIAGGPPCQPFSLGGQHRAWDDGRDLWSEAIRAVRETRPRAFIFENVKGLTRQKFADYLEYITLQLSHPGIVMKRGESWSDHRTRLERHHCRGAKKAPEYRVVFRLLNAADYGVPQQRQRVFFVGFREDMGTSWSFPEATHSRESLLYQKWITGEYWKRHGIRPQQEKPPRRVIEELSSELYPAIRKPWQTVRDALVGLPDPRTPHDILNHEYRGNAKQYPGHTGSALDEPAKAIKAGVHGVPGGENMLIQDDGKPRYFTAREAARIQTFPDRYVLKGSWTESMRQLGNAVPVSLAQVIAQSVIKSLGK